MALLKCVGCKKEFKSRSLKRKYCSHQCYSQAKIGRHISFDTNGDKNPKWRGGLRINKFGYVFIYSPYHPYCNIDKVVVEHRLIMEKKIKRFLMPSEVIHHKNGITSDNRIENLELMSKSEHSILHKKLKSR